MRYLCEFDRKKVVKMVTLSGSLLVFVTAINHDFVLSFPQTPNLYQVQEQYQGPLQYQGPSQYQGLPQYRGSQQYEGPYQFRGPQQYQGADHFQGPQQYQGDGQFQGPQQNQGAYQFQGAPQYQGPQQYQEALQQGAPQQVANTEGDEDYPLGPLQNISPDLNTWLQYQTDPERTNMKTISSNCSKSDYPSIIEMDQGKRNGTVDDSNSCYFACFLRELGFINEEGFYTAEGALEHAKKSFGFADRRLPEVIALISAGADCEKVNTIAVSDGWMGCERAKLLFNCWDDADKAFKKV